MLILPAIDLYGGKAVRLFKGDYSQMTVYDSDPVAVAKRFRDAGAEFIHTVDLEGARDGTTPNLSVIERIVNETGLKVEIGGGIRTDQTVEEYLSIGVRRVILGTAAVTNEALLIRSLDKYGDKIAVGADIKDGYIAIKGWLEKSKITADDFFAKMDLLGVATVICTDISKDGAMKGANRELYRELSEKYRTNIVASGGVASLEDISALRDMGLYGAILGKAYYVGAVDLKTAIEVAK